MLRSRNVISLTGALFLALWPAAAGAAGGEASEAPRPRGSRFVHRIKLLDEKGGAITPESTEPYSPRQTCSSAECHSADAVAQGTHTRMVPPGSADPKAPPAQAWTLFQPATGMAAPLSAGFLRPSKGEFDPRTQLSMFDFAHFFGGLCPGGGRLELDAQGKRYDARLAEDPTLAKGNDPDYANASWDQSGVLETDCLACHARRDYDHIERANQIDKMNLKWAPTAGAGFGIVEGFGTSRKVKYSPALFDAEGKVLVEVGVPRDRNCLACHRRPARGDATWRDGLAADVHSEAGIRCADCHSSGLDHVLAGDPRAAGRPGAASLTCAGCHASGRRGAPVPRHKGLPRLHLRRIACAACHAGPRPRVVPLALEQPTRVQWGIPLGNATPAGPLVWAPIYQAAPVTLGIRMLPSFPAVRAEGALLPLNLETLGTVFRDIASQIKDDNGDGQPEVDTPAEIKLVLEAIKKKDLKPAYLLAGRAYELGEGGELKSEPNPLADPIDNPLAHNVRPAAQALGAGGCTECHDQGAAFFLSVALTRVPGKDTRTEGAPLYKRIGRDEADLRLGSLREAWLRPYAPWALAIAVLAMLLHYVVFGPRRADLTGPLVPRYNWLERLVHFGLLGSFVALAVTGLWITSGGEAWLGLALDAIHTAASWVLVGSALLALLMWGWHMVFRRVDLGWARVAGGYLGTQGRVPAGRFSAGQKLFFWAAMATVALLAASGFAILFDAPARYHSVAYTVHDLCAYVMVLLVLGHAYFGSLAKPGTLRSIFEGKVPRTWLEHHHPDFRPKENGPKI